MVPIWVRFALVSQFFTHAHSYHQRWLLVFHRTSGPQELTGRRRRRRQVNASGWAAFNLVCMRRRRRRRHTSLARAERRCLQSRCFKALDATLTDPTGKRPKATQQASERASEKRNCFHSDARQHLPVADLRVGPVSSSSSSLSSRRSHAISATRLRRRTRRRKRRPTQPRQR